MQRAAVIRSTVLTTLAPLPLICCWFTGFGAAFSRSGSLCASVAVMLVAYLALFLALLIAERDHAGLAAAPVSAELRGADGPQGSAQLLWLLIGSSAAMRLQPRAFCSMQPTGIKCAP